MIKDTLISVSNTGEPVALRNEGDALAEENDLNPGHRDSSRPMVTSRPVAVGSGEYTRLDPLSQAKHPPKYEIPLRLVPCCGDSSLVKQNGRRADMVTVTNATDMPESDGYLSLQ